MADFLKKIKNIKPTGIGPGGLDPVLRPARRETGDADQLGAYCASKAAVEMLMKHMAAELGNYRINVNAILPGVIETGMTTPMLRDERMKRMLIRETPVGRWGQPQDIADVAALKKAPSHE